MNYFRLMSQQSSTCFDAANTNNYMFTGLSAWFQVKITINRLIKKSFRLSIKSFWCNCIIHDDSLTFISVIIVRVYGISLCIGLHCNIFKRNSRISRRCTVIICAYCVQQFGICKSAQHFHIMPCVWLLASYSVEIA